MGVPSLEAIGDQIFPVGARKLFHQQAILAWQDRAPLLDAQPFLDRAGQGRPVMVVGQQIAHAGRQMGGQRQPPADIGRHRRLAHAAAPGDQRHVANFLEGQQLAGENETVAGAQHLGEILLHLAKPATADTHFQGLRLDNGADIHAIGQRGARIGAFEAAVGGHGQTAKTLVAGQRVAAGGDELDHRVKVGAGKVGVRCRAAHFGE